MGLPRYTDAELEEIQYVQSFRENSTENPIAQWMESEEWTRIPDNYADEPRNLTISGEIDVP